MNFKEVLYDRLPTMTLEDLYGYINEIEGGYIKAQYHPKNHDIVILNYTELTTFEKRWNKYTMSARGLILDLSYIIDTGKIYILAKPFDKFPNYGTNEIDGYEDDIDFNEIESVMEKMDGSLGISYFFDGEIHFATRGSFISEQAIKAKEIWDREYARNEDMYVYCSAPVTYLVEIIYPQNRVVVDYKNREELVMIGVNVLMNVNKSILDMDYYMLIKEAHDLGMPLARQYSYSLDDMLELKDKISANEEGWIIKFKNGKRLKIKGSEYMNVHRTMYGLSDKAKVKAWSENKIDELILSMPEEFRNEIEDLRDRLNYRLKVIRRTAIELYYGAINLHRNRKDFAIFVNNAISQPYRKFIFIAYDNDGIIPEQFIREHIYKDYTYYLEVIGWNNKDS